MPGRIAENYANVLFDIAEEDNATDRVFEELRDIAEIFIKGETFTEFFVSKALRKRDKQGVITHAFEKTHYPSLVSLLRLLVDNDRFAFISEIAEAFRRRYNEKMNRMDVICKTPFPLSKAEEKRLIAVLSHRFKKDIILHVETDRELIGGIILSVGDEEYDFSVRDALHSMRSNILDATQKERTTNED